jgi:hypothetical protein
VASETLVFYICHEGAVPELLRENVNKDAIMFWGAAIQCDVHMLDYYGITIPGARDLQKKISNPTVNYPPGLYALVNAYIGTNLFLNDAKIAAIRKMDGPTYH